MRSYKNVQCLVINKKIIRDNDILLTLLTPNEGKITALAKGVRNIKSRRLGSIQLGNTIKAHIYIKDNYNYLSETETIYSFMNYNHNLIQHNLLYYFLETINNLLASEQYIPKIYDICQKIIIAISENKFQNYIYYEIQFIQQLGFGLPPEIVTAYNKKDYKDTQRLIKSFFESIIEKPLESNKLF
jgi:DNA repair protein RecO (recombination protein O)